MIMIRTWRDLEKVLGSELDILTAVKDHPGKVLVSTAMSSAAEFVRVAKIFKDWSSLIFKSIAESKMVESLHRKLGLETTGGPHWKAFRLLVGSFEVFLSKNPRAIPLAKALATQLKLVSEELIKSAKLDRNAPPESVVKLEEIFDKLVKMAIVSEGLKLPDADPLGLQ